MENNTNTTRNKIDTAPRSPKRSLSPMAIRKKVNLSSMPNQMYPIPQHFFDKKNGMQKNETKIIIDAEKKSNLSPEARGRNIPDNTQESTKSYL